MSESEELDRLAIHCVKCKAVLNDKDCWVLVDAPDEIWCEDCYEEEYETGTST